MDDLKNKNHSSSVNSTDYTEEEEINDFYDTGYRLRLMLASPHEIIAFVIGLIAIILNVLVLAGLYVVRRPITTHYRLIISLACADIIVGTSMICHQINHVLNPIYLVGGTLHEHERLVSRCSYLVIKSLNTIGLNVQLLNLACMAIDHYVAIMKPLQYPILLRKKRVIFGIAMIWTISIILGYSDFLSALHLRLNYYKREFGYNYCEVVWMTRYQEEYTVLAIAPFCFCLMLFTYIRIYIKVRRHRQPGVISQSERPGVRKATKALITTLLNLGTFMITYLPLCFFQVILLIQAYTNRDAVLSNMEKLQTVDKYLMDLLIINAILDSIIYTVRIREVKEGICMILHCRKRSSLPGYRSRQASLSSSKDTVSVRLSLSRQWGSRDKASKPEGSGVRDSFLFQDVTEKF